MELGHDLAVGSASVMGSPMGSHMGLRGARLAPSRDHEEADCVGIEDGCEGEGAASSPRLRESSCVRARARVSTGVSAMVTARDLSW